MSIIAILGSGPLGGALARKLAERSRVCEVRLIDSNRNSAAGTALDIQQAAPLDGYATRIITGGLDAVIGATVVAVADPADQPALGWPKEAAFNLLKQITRLTVSTPVVCAGASDGALISMAVCRLGVNRDQIFGSAPGALVSGLKALIALEAKVSPEEVSVNIVGLPPAHTIVAWSSATICSCPLQEYLSINQLTRLRGRVAKLWPPGPYTLASVTSRVVEALISADSRRTFTCFVAEDSSGEIPVRSNRVTLNANGIHTVIAPHLSQAEYVQLETAVNRRLIKNPLNT